MSASARRPAVFVAGLIPVIAFGVVVGQRLEREFGPILGVAAASLVWLFAARLIGDARAGASNLRSAVASNRRFGGLSFSIDIFQTGRLLLVGTAGGLALLSITNTEALRSTCVYLASFSGPPNADLATEILNRLGPLAWPVVVLLAIGTAVWLVLVFMPIAFGIRWLTNRANAIDYSGPISTSLRLVLVPLAAGGLFVLWLCCIVAALFPAAWVVALPLLIPLSAANGSPAAPFLGYSAFVCSLGYIFGELVRTPTTHGFREFGYALAVLMLLPVAIEPLFGTPQICSG